MSALAMKVGSDYVNEAALKISFKKQRQAMGLLIVEML